MPENRNAFKLEVVGALTTGVKDRWEAPFNGEITGIAVAVGTAPTGAAAIFDLVKNGTTVYSTTANRPTVAISALETAGAGAGVPDVKAFAAGDTIELNVVQVGSSVAGADADVVVAYIAT